MLYSITKDIKEAVNRELGTNRVNLGDSCKMQALPKTDRSSQFTILALQDGDIAILVWARFDKDGVHVHHVRRCAW